MSKKIMFKDLVANKSYEELMQLLPCMICVEDETEPNVRYRYHSFNVVGFGPDYIIAGHSVTQYDEDAFWGSGNYKINAYKIFPFDKLENCVYAHTLTEKQREWYEKKNLDYQCVSGYEAWNVINASIKESQAQRQLVQTPRQLEEDAPIEEKESWPWWL